MPGDVACTMFGCAPDLESWFSDLAFALDPSSPPQGVALDQSDMVTEADRQAGYLAIQNQQQLAPAGQGIQAWLKQNSTAVYAGAGILVLMAMFGGKRR